MQKNIFFRRGTDILLLVDGRLNKGDIAFVTRTMYNHVHQILKKFEQEGIVSSELKGREREITLTKKGAGIKKSLLEMIKLLENKSVGGE